MFLTKKILLICLHVTVMLNVYKKRDLYWHGLKFLLKDSENWPVQVIDINEERKSEHYAECTTNFVGSVNSKNKSYFTENVIKIEHFSSLKNLFRVNCYVSGFLRRIY